MNLTARLKAVDIDIPGYQVLRLIGEGGMASVFLAVQKSLDREVALKIMSPVLASNPEFANRFLTEARITAKLQHPNLLTVHDVGSYRGIYYLATEYISGGTLKELMSEGNLSVTKILGIICDIANALHFAHQKGFVHRDVKPGNVLFRTNGQAVLADFGIAKAIDGSSHATITGASIGTPSYMSPEQARADQIDGRSDLYSLGTVLYEMLMGYAPYQASDPFTVALMHMTHPIPQLPIEFTWLQPVLNGLMAKLPQDRYSTGGALIEAIHSLPTASLQGVKSLPPHSSQIIGSNEAIDGAMAQQTIRWNLLRRNLSWTSEYSAWLVHGVVGVGLLIVVLFAWSWFGRMATKPLPMPVPTHVKLPQSIDAPMQQVDALLAQADAYLARGTEPASPDLNRMVVFPEDESALGYYRRVLEIDHDNARAQQGIEKIANFYKGYAYKLCRLEQWGNCMAIARTGLIAQPADRYLIELSELAEQGRNGIDVQLKPPR